MLDTDERSIALLPSPYTMFKLQHKTLLSMLLVPLFINSLIPQYLYFYRRGFRLPQRSHLRTLKNFVSEKSGKRCEKSGKHEIKLGNREILRRLIFFPVSAPVLPFDYKSFNHLSHHAGNIMSSDRWDMEYCVSR